MHILNKDFKKDSKVYDNQEYLTEEFIIWNGSYGVRDFVTISHTKNDTNKNTIYAWLDEPYEMVGPFNLDELYQNGQITFAACTVMTKTRWVKDKYFLYDESMIQQRKAQEKFNEQIHQHNKKRRQYHNNLEQDSEKKHRELLCLPINGVLEISQIKIAYRKIVKKVHPDVGGNAELFIQITHARDALLGQ